MENNRTIALKISGLNKTLGKKHILHDIDLEAYKGEVFGFLGPNGAGKTTTIKIIVGLLSLDDGEIEVNGFDIRKNYEKALEGIGGIVENPEMYKHLTGKQNLRQYARMRSGITEKRINEVVNLVGLSNRIDEKISKYSLGMRQRLGVAQSILHHPSVLILDEPTNGLDPAGIKELRDILKELAHKENICVIVSSHLMSEMELMCDRVGIISNGKMLGVYTIEEMINANKNGVIEYDIEVNDTEKASEALEGRDFNVNDMIVTVSVSSDNSKAEISKIISDLVKGGTDIYYVTPKENKKLEDVFIEITNSGGVQID
ncbi:MAG: ABC transporter ATP-binding protein [Ruminococcus sp.]|nr:ABC transporter ATP-binding protein [Ruminococcus sp.]